MKLDPVDQKALKGPHSSAKDKDINNDGKVNSSDEYLHKRRQAVSKALGKLKEAALEEKKLTDKQVKNALASAKAKPKEMVSLKKPPFKMDEEAEELDEVSASTLGSYIRKSSKDADASMKKRDNALDNDDGETARKMGRIARKRDKGTDMAMDKLKGTRYAKVHATEEADLDEAKKPKPGNNAMVMAKNIGKVLSAVKKEEAPMNGEKPLRMKLAQFRNQE
jgi:hypothetical protein